MKKKMIFMSLLTLLLLFACTLLVYADSNLTPSGDYVVDGEVSETESKTISGNLYISYGALYEIKCDLNVTGDIYVFGTMFNYGHINTSGTLNCLNYIRSGLSFNAGNYDFGYVYDFGGVTAYKLNVKDDFLSTQIPSVTPTVTPTPTAIPTPTVTPKPTAAPTPTVTPRPTATPMPTATPTPTLVPTDPFEDYDNFSKAEQEIVASSYTKTLGNAPFSLGARLVEGNGSLSYQSSNPKIVSVSSSGKATIKGVGKVTVTITASATEDYNKVVKKITVTVNPKGVKLTSVKNSSSKKLSVQWKRNKSATGYQIRYSTKSSFKGSKTVTTKKNSTVKTTISKLKKGKTYYVQVRTYKKVSGKNYYSAWSGKKAAKIRK